MDLNTSQIALLVLVAALSYLLARRYSDDEAKERDGSVCAIIVLRDVPY